MQLDVLLTALSNTPEQVEFQQVIETIDKHYDYHPSKFSNGNTVNKAGSNEGSCKIFAFALLNQLSESQTLACFGHYYREDVLQHPDGDDHANIRNFMTTGWAGVHFSSNALISKTT